MRMVIQRFRSVVESLRRLFAERALVRVLALVVALGPLLVVVLTAYPTAGQHSALATSSVTPGWEPDASSVGSITFTDATGAVVTSGSINSPLAAFAVGSKLADTGDKDGSLQVFLPVQGQLPALWSGEAIGIDTVFNPAPSAWPANLKTLASGGLPVIIEPSNDLKPSDFSADFPNTSTESRVPEPVPSSNVHRNQHVDLRLSRRASQSDRRHMASRVPRRVKHAANGVAECLAVAESFSDSECKSESDTKCKSEPDTKSEPVGLAERGDGRCYGFFRQCARDKSEPFAGYLRIAPGRRLYGRGERWRHAALDTADAASGDGG